MATQIDANDISYSYGAVSVGDLTFEGLKGTSAITITGTWSAASLTTGPDTGTAGSGTTTTSMVQPTGATNWTASEMRGMFLHITGGAGSGTVRPIITNSTTAVTVHAITGMDNTSVFEIVNPGTTLGTVTITDCHMPIEIQNCKITRLLTTDNESVTVTACEAETSNASGSWLSTRDNKLKVDSCLFESSSSLKVLTGNEIDVEATVYDDAWSIFNECVDLALAVDADSCDAIGVLIERCVRVLIEYEANNCSAIPLHLVGVHNLSPQGNGVTGTTGNTGTVGVDMEAGGYYDLTGADLTATADMRIEGSTQTYSNLSLYTTIVSKGTAVTVTS